MKRKQQPKRGAASPSFNWGRSKLITEGSVLAKRANQRLREIEKQGLESSSNAYQYVERAGFDKKNGESIEKTWWASTTKQGQIKFNTNFRGMTDKQIREQIERLKDFLEAKTSKTKGVRVKLDKLTDKFNKKIAESAGETYEYTTEEFAEIMKENLTKQLFSIFDPSEVMRLFSEDPSYWLNSEQILAALVAEEKRSLAHMSFETVRNAFHNWKSNKADESGPTVDQEKPPWEF